MAALSEETVAARLQLDCSSAGASSDVIVKVAEAIVNGSKDFICDFVSFAALGRDGNRGSARVPSELRVAVKRACCVHKAVWADLGPLIHTRLYWKAAIRLAHDKGAAVKVTIRQNT